MAIPYLSNSRAMWGTELSTALHAALARMEAPVCVSEKAFSANPDWLKVGFELLKATSAIPAIT